MVGLTDDIGSGKSYMADRFAERSAVIVDTNAIAYEITAPGGATIPKLVETFGTGILCSDGTMDRDVMHALAFSGTMAKSRLERITHLLIRGIALSHRAATQASGAHPYLVYVAPLPVESLAGHHDWRSLVGHILTVDYPVDAQIARVMARNELPRAQVEAIIAHQTSREACLATADDMIDDNDTLTDLLPQIDRLDPTCRSSRNALKVTVTPLCIVMNEGLAWNADRPRPNGLRNRIYRQISTPGTRVSILYEYPFDERIRTLLHLEDPFRRLDFFLVQKHPL